MKKKVTERRSPKKSARPMSDAQLAEALQHFEVKRAREEAAWLLSLVKPTGAVALHLIAEQFNRTGSFEGFEHIIRGAAEAGVKDFFITLGKLLEGKRLKPNTWSKRDEDIAFVLCLNPDIKSTEAVQFLRERGHLMSPLAFKQTQYNWRRAAGRTRDWLKQRGSRFCSIHIPLLDGAPEDTPQE
jgi:hypothetical protein